MLTSTGLRGTALPVRLGRQTPKCVQAPRLVCAAKKQAPVKRTSGSERTEDTPKILAVPLLAAALAGLMLTSAVVPEDAFAARSSGRVGGSSFRSAAPSVSRGGGGGGVSRGNSYRGGNTYNSVTVAPSIGGYGGGYGGGYYPGGFGGGITVFPSFYSPPVMGVALPLGVIFNLTFTLLVVGAVFAVIKSAFTAITNRGSNKRDEWD